MTFWRRAPRSVYQVYDEESYLSGEGAAARVGEPTGADGTVGVGEPTGASGPVGAGRQVGDGREQMQALSHGPRAVRLLTLGLLGVVTVIAATIVAAQVLHHSQQPPSPVAAHRDRTRSAWTATPQPPMPTPASRLQPGSTTRTVTPESVASAPAVPTPPAHSSVAASPGGFGRSGGSIVSPTITPTRSSAGVADAASLPASELPSTNASSPEGASLSASESQVDGEFGFER